MMYILRRKEKNENIHHLSGHHFNEVKCQRWRDNFTDKCRPHWYDIACTYHLIMSFSSHSPKFRTSNVHMRYQLILFVTAYLKSVCFNWLIIKRQCVLVRSQHISKLSFSTQSKWLFTTFITQTIFVWWHFVPSLLALFSRVLWSLWTSKCLKPMESGNSTYETLVVHMLSV